MKVIAFIEITEPEYDQRYGIDVGRGRVGSGASVLGSRENSVGAGSIVGSVTVLGGTEVLVGLAEDGFVGSVVGGCTHVHAARKIAAAIDRQ